MRWTEVHDLEMVKEILTERPFDHAKGTRQIGLAWQKIADNLNSRADVVFNLKDIRAVRDRFTLLEKKFKKREREEINASGINTDEPSEFDSAMEEAVALFESQEDKREKEKSVKQDDRNKAEDVRLVALETARETAKRKADLGLDSCRAKKATTMDYLREKADKEIQYKKMELEYKTKELEVRKQELELRSKEFEAQKAQTQDMFKTLLALAKHN